MGLRLDSLAVDARDPEALARWWQHVLGGEVVREQETVPRLVGAPGCPPLDFLRPDDQAAEVARVEALGASRADVGQGDDVPWVVLADPEGNVFCIPGEAAA